MQRRLHHDAAHAAYSGVEVLRDLGRAAGEQVLAPVVFTSGLNLGELFDERARRHFGDPVWMISQGPQVLLDAQITEVGGRILVNWDVRADAFADGVPEAMFAAFETIVRGLADDRTWTEPVGALLPVGQRRSGAGQRHRLPGGPPAGTLHERFFAEARVGPPRPSLWARRRAHLRRARRPRAAGRPAGSWRGASGPAIRSAVTLPKRPRSGRRGARRARRGRRLRPARHRAAAGAGGPDHRGAGVPGRRSPRWDGVGVRRHRCPPRWRWTPSSPRTCSSPPAPPASRRVSRYRTGPPSTTVDDLIAGSGSARPTGRSPCRRSTSTCRCSTSSRCSPSGAPSLRSPRGSSATPTAGRRSCASTASPC